MYDYVTINPKKPKQITWRYLPNPRKKRQKLPDEQLEIPQILEREWILLILTYSLKLFFIYYDIELGSLTLYLKHDIHLIEEMLSVDLFL